MNSRKRTITKRKRAVILLACLMLLSCVSASAETVKNRWVEKDGKKYYYNGSGKTVVGSFKIEDAYYIFNKKGVLLQPAQKKEVIIKGVRYQVKPGGKAAPGWNRKKTYYYGKTGEAKKGVVMLNNKFFFFGKKGKYDRNKTIKIRHAAKEKKNIKLLLKLIGKPKKRKYYSGSCYSFDGKDGVLTYPGFTVYTCKYKNKKEIFVSAGTD